MKDGKAYQPKASSPDASIFTAVRAQLAQAEGNLQIACGIMRNGGSPENADELLKELRRLRVWTGRDGWLDMLETGAKKGNTE